MQIRLAVPSENELLTDLAFRSKSFWPYREQDLIRYRSSLEVHAEDILRKSVYVAEIEGKIIGFYGISSEPDVHRLYFLFLEPKFIGKGFGKKLWDHLLNNVKNKGWRSLTFYSDPYAMKQFYRFQNCIPVGQLQTDLGVLIELRVDLIEG